MVSLLIVTDLLCGQYINYLTLYFYSCRSDDVKNHIRTVHFIQIQTKYFFITCSLFHIVDNQLIFFSCQLNRTFPVMHMSCIESRPHLCHHGTLQLMIRTYLIYFYYWWSDKMLDLRSRTFCSWNRWNRKIEHIKSSLSHSTTHWTPTI